MITTIDPSYVTYITTVDANGKTTVKIIIDKTGLPENAKKVHLSYIYIKAPDEPDNSGSGSSDIPSPPVEEDVPQPTAGTVMTVGETVTIDENTEYPITGEFELDGVPASIEGIVSITKIGNKDCTSYSFGTYNDYNYLNNESQGQLEWIQSNIYHKGTGIALRGTKIND